MPEKLWTSCSKKGNRRGVCFEADASVVDDQNCVERTIKDGLEFAFGRVECASRLALLTSSQEQETGMESDRHCESKEDRDEQDGRQASVVRPRQERSDQHNDQSQSNYE